MTSLFWIVCYKSPKFCSQTGQKRKISCSTTDVIDGTSFSCTSPNDSHQMDIKQVTPFIYLSINQLDAQKFCFTISLFHASTVRAHILIIRRSKLHYTASGIITPIAGHLVHRLIRVLSQPVHETATFWCDDTRGCVMQFWPSDDEHMVLETCTGMK